MLRTDAHVIAQEPRLSRAVPCAACTQCATVAARKSASGCAALELDLLGWLAADPDEMKARGLDHKDTLKLSHEVRG